MDKYVIKTSNYEDRNDGRGTYNEEVIEISRKDKGNFRLSEILYILGNYPKFNDSEIRLLETEEGYNLTYIILRERMYKSYPTTYEVVFQTDKRGY